MIDPPAIPDRDALVQRTARTMWLAFIVAACGFIALAHFRLKPQAQPVPDPTVTYVLTAVAAVDLVIFAVLRNIRLRNSREQRTRGDAVLAHNTWLSAQILGFASAMSIVLFGFALYIVGAPPHWASIVLFVAGLINLIAYRPQASE